MAIDSATVRGPEQEPPYGRHPRILLCGPFPSPDGMVGGYARVNAFVAGSELAQRLGVAPLPVTLPHEGSLPRRLVEDVRRARRALAAGSVRVLHLTAQYHAGTYREWLQYRLARSTGRAFLLDIRGGCFVEAFEDPGSPLRRALWERMITGADAITVEGRADARWLARRFGRTATWFPNFVRAADREAHPPAPLARPPAGAPVELVYAGQLRPEKGLRELVGACLLLERRGVPVALTLAGVGDERFARTLETQAGALAAGRFRLAGRLDHGALLALLRRSHVFVFPSRWHCEGHANAVNEAMQAGLPVVASRQGFSEDVVTPECGALLDAVGAEEIAAAVAGLVSDWDVLVARGRAARERVYAEFSDTVALARLEEVYRVLLDAAPG